MQDRRQRVRDKVLYGGVAEISERGATLKCVVRNLSDAGACLELDGRANLPEQDNLTLARTDDLAPGQQGRALLPRHDHGYAGIRSRRAAAQEREEEARAPAPHQGTARRRLSAVDQPARTVT